MPRWQRVRLDRIVMRQAHSLKEVIAAATIVKPAQHAAVLETGGRICMGTGRCVRAFRGVPYFRSLCDGRV